MDIDIGGFRAGEPDAIRAVYRQYGPAVKTVARSVLGRDSESVADVVQLTFTKAWKAASTFEEGRDLAPWLYAIARRCAIDVARHENRPTTGGHAPETDAAVEPPSFQKTWERYEIRRVIDTLPNGEQDVVRLQHMVGLTHNEIAIRLDVPLGTIKSRSNRAHRRLAAALGHLSLDEDYREPSSRSERRGG